MRFTQPAAARAVNRLRVLNLIEQQPGLSRAQAARILALNKVSTGEIVEILLSENLIEESGKFSGGNGRPATALLLKKDAKAILAVDMGTKATSVALCDLGGNLLRFERFPTPSDPKPEELCVQVIKTCLRIMKMMKDPSILLGIAISVPGTLSEDRQSISSAPAWNWKDIPLAQAISSNTHLPVVLDNNVRSMVMGEQWFNAQQAPQSMLYVNWGEHVSAAWVVDGKITNEENHFGHMPLHTGKPCRCGATGCLETVAAGWALTQQAQEATGTAELTVKQMCQQADPRTAPILSNAAQAMGEALALAAITTGCSSITLGGGISLMPDTYIGQLKQSFEQTASSRLSDVSIERTALGDKAGILGTAAVGLDAFLFHKSMLQQLENTSNDRQ